MSDKYAMICICDDYTIMLPCGTYTLICRLDWSIYTVMCRLYFGIYRIIWYLYKYVLIRLCGRCAFKYTLVWEVVIKLYVDQCELKMLKEIVCIVDMQLVSVWVQHNVEIVCN